jgi:hypothetical protein
MQQWQLNDIDATMGGAMIYDSNNQHGIWLVCRVKKIKSMWSFLWKDMEFP